MKSSSFVFMEGVLLLTSAIFMFALIILGYTIADLRCRKIVSAEPDAVLPQQPRHKSLNVFFQKPGRYDKQYGSFPEKVRLEMLKASREMFTFGFDNYMKYAFPQDELNPIDCAGRGPDVDNPSNVNINDVLGDYSLTLVDSLDTLAVMGNVSEFKKAVQLVLDYVSFDKDVTIQVFEANIRLLGGLLSAHFLITDPNQIFGDLRPPNYTRELLDLAHDLATRLLPAFENSSTGLPYPRVNLRHGVPKNENCDWCLTQTCTAGAGSLLLEFGLLSRLVNDPIFDTVARRAARILWRSRAKNTGLLGNVIDVETGEWVGKMSGLGAGLDSFYEYLLKSYILFGEDDDYRMFNESYHLIKRYLRRGRDHCNEGYGNHPLYVNVNMIDGSLLTLWIDSLQAAFAGVQVLNGDIEEAICTHALYYAIWKRYGALPERFNWQHLSPDLAFYPLRPELVESTYLLYQATKNPFYLHVGRDILTSLNNHTRVKCGYATIHNVQDKTLEDRMESFFLSETCKYLYLLFDIENPLNKQPTNFVFSTEGHLFPISWKLRRNVWEEDDAVYKNSANDSIKKNQTQSSCKRINEDRHHLLPLKNNYLHQIVESLSIDDS